MAFLPVALRAIFDHAAAVRKQRGFEPVAMLNAKALTLRPN